MVTFINITDTDGNKLLINVNHIMVIENCERFYVITMSNNWKLDSYNSNKIYTKDNVIDILNDVKRHS